MEEKIEEQETHHVKKNKSYEVAEKMRKNPWIVSTVVLGVLVLIFLVGSVSMTGKVISEKQAGEAVIDFVQSQTGAGELLSVENYDSNLYMVTINYQGQEIPLFITKDGKNLVQGLTPLVAEKEKESPTSTEVPKSDKPEVELFIWSYCPYGVQAEAPYTEVAKLLKNYADFKVVMYYDGHGEHETQQNKIEACMQELGIEQFWDYANAFTEDIYPVCGASRDAQCNEEKSIALMKSLGIDSNAVMSCVESQGDSLIAQDSARAQEMGVTGSPTLVVNGVIASPSSRTAEAFKDVVCSAFNDAPEACAVELSSSAGTASGNC